MYVYLARFKPLISFIRELLLKDRPYLIHGKITKILKLIYKHIVSMFIPQHSSEINCEVLTLKYI